jgi:ribosomal protein L32
MIGFLFGLAVALPIGVLMGAWAAAIYEERMGREVDRVFLDRKRLAFEPEPWVRKVAGVQVCSCIGATHGPHFVDSDCPFHGGAA